MTRQIDTDPEWDLSDSDENPRKPYGKWWKDTIGKRIKYAVVREYWDKPIAEIEELEVFSVGSYDLVSQKVTPEDRYVLHLIGQAGIKTLVQFLDSVDSLQKAKEFCRKAGITPDELKSLLRKVHRYLPFGAQMRQLVAKEDTGFQVYVDKLLSVKIGHSLALLDAGHTRTGRKQISEETGIPEPAVLDLVKRADLTRLHVMGGGMVKNIWAAGYKGLSDLKKADPDEYYARCQDYYSRNYKGMPYDFTPETIRDFITRMKQVPDIIEE